MSEATAKSGPRKPPITAVGPIAWAKTNLFSGWLSTAVTLAMGYLVIRLGLSFIDWAFVKAIWSVPMGPTGAQTQSCRDLQGAGACWAVIADKHASCCLAPILTNSIGARRWPACCSLFSM